MSTITLWGRLSSANVQKVVWALEELGPGYDHVAVGDDVPARLGVAVLAADPDTGGRAGRCCHSGSHRRHHPLVFPSWSASSRRLLAGARLTYADLAAGALYRWMTMPIERPDLPAVASWYVRLSARPAFVKAVCVSYEELRGRVTF